MVVVDNIKISRTSLIYVPLKRTFPSKQSGFSLQLAMRNHRMMGWWCGETPCCKTKTKFADTSQQPNSRLSCGAGSMPGRYEINYSIPQSVSQTGHKLCGGDDSFVDIHDFKILTGVNIGHIARSSYISFVYNLL